jgi:hypothetical protein
LTPTIIDLGGWLHKNNILLHVIGLEGI